MMPKVEYLVREIKCWSCFQYLQTLTSSQIPYTVESKVGEVDYIIKTSDRRKSRQLCHINMVKEYVDRSDDDDDIVKPVCSVGSR